MHTPAWYRVPAASARVLHHCAIRYNTPIPEPALIAGAFMAALPSRKKLYFFVLLLVGVYAAAYDMYAPALPELGQYFNVASGSVQVTMTLYAAAGVVATLPIGWLNDALGRRRCSIILAALVVTGSLLCLGSPGLWLFYLGRILQGIGGSGLYIVAISLPKDILQPKEFLKVWQWLTLIFYLAPSIATAIGGYVVFHLSWKAVFIIISVLSLLTILCVSFFLDETNPLQQQPDRQPSTNKTTTLKRYRTVVSSSRFMTYSYITALAWAGMGSFYLFLPFIINTLNGSAMIFGWVAFAMVIAGVCGRLLNLFILSYYYTLEELVRFFCALNVASGLLLFLPLLAPAGLALPLLAGATILFGFSAAIAAIAASSLALSQFDHQHSSAASAIYGLTIDLFITMALVVSTLLPATTAALGSFIVTLCLTGLVLVWRCQRYERQGSAGP